MSYLKLIKLLYLVDREALNLWGRPVTFDQYVSMDHGQVLSHTLDLIDEGVPPGEENQSYWLQHISVPTSREVTLEKDTPTDELSEVEVTLIKDIFEKFGHLSRWELRKIHHDLPEYVDPHGSCVPTEYKDILRSFGKTEAEIAAILNELKLLESTDSILGQ